MGPRRRYALSSAVRLATRGLVAGALLAGSTAVAASDGAGPVAGGPTTAPPTRVAFFNNPVLTWSTPQLSAGDEGEALTIPRTPSPGGPSGITTAIVSLLSSATARSTVTIAMYSANGGDAATPGSDTSYVREAIRQAARRGAAVNVVVDGVRSTSFWEPLDAMPGVTVRRCRSACYFPGRSVMHNKFVLVDDTVWTPGRENVVLQMTANWNDGQLARGNWNSALQVWGDQRLYDAYLRYHRQLFSCSPRCTGAPRPQDAAAAGARLAVFPRAGADDPVLRDLVALSGCGPAGGVDVAVNDWRQDRRGLAILARLEALSRAGCEVRIVVPRGRAGVDIGSLLPRTSLARTAHCTGFAAPGYPTPVTDVSVPDPRTVLPRVHSKYVLLRGRYDGVPNMLVVSTGSERFAAGARSRADETWLTLTAAAGSHLPNAAVYGQFAVNFDRMYALTPPCSASPPTG